METTNNPEIINQAINIFLYAKKLNIKKYTKTEK